MIKTGLDVSPGLFDLVLIKYFDGWARPTSVKGIEDLLNVLDAAVPEALDDADMYVHVVTRDFEER